MDNYNFKNVILFFDNEYDSYCANNNNYQNIVLLLLTLVNELVII